MTMITDQNATEFEPHVFVTEASDLQLQGWPEQLPTNLGNGLPFIRRTKKLDADGDIMWVRYRQANGCVELKVFND